MPEAAGVTLSLDGAASPSTAAAALAPLATPDAPIFAGASITSITIQWQPVEGATGYYVDFEPRSAVGTDELTAAEGQWLGTVGGRASVGGSTVITGKLFDPLTHAPQVAADGHLTATVNGLQKNSAYAFRVTALRRVNLQLSANAPALEAHQQSKPSKPSAIVRTLNPKAEIARLTSDNARLGAEVAKIPGLQQSVARLETELSAAHSDIAAAEREIARLNGEVSKRDSELAAAAAKAQQQAKTIASRDATIAERDKEVARLAGVESRLRAELSGAHAQINGLEADVADRDDELAKAKETASKEHQRGGALDTELASARSKVVELEGSLRAKENARADLARQLEKVTAQVRSTLVALLTFSCVQHEAKGAHSLISYALSSLSLPFPSPRLQLRSARSDDDVVIEKMKDDVAKVMDELQVSRCFGSMMFVIAHSLTFSLFVHSHSPLQRVQADLHSAQNYVSSIEPDANIVRELRERQQRWDAEHAAIESGHDLHTGEHISALRKMGALRKLGPRPTLTL